MDFDELREAVNVGEFPFETEEEYENYLAYQEGILTDLACGMETMSEEEQDDLYNQLDFDHQMKAYDDACEFANNAVGDEHWNSDD